MTPYEREVGEQFERDIAEHQLTVMHDDGLYRHVRLAKPDRNTYWFDLVTWPGNLVIKGDMGSFTFSRLPDMFEFFRRPGGWKVHDTINPGYWSEKTPHRTVTVNYSEDKFRQIVAEHVAEHEADFPGLTKAVEDEIFDPYLADITYEDGARRALDGFVFDLGAGVVGGLEFRFTDTWEWSFKDWDYHYLWCCNAIQWGIDQYDKGRAEAGEPR